MPPESSRKYKVRPLEADPAVEEEEERRYAKRRPTVYDAVAGRVTLRNLATTPSTSSQRENGLPLRPDEILYKARNAPTRYEETDHYFAHTRLPEGQSLPSGDLLSALHAYIANFYERSEEQVNQKVWRSMDGTALIALGILVEESVKEVLGETGDLVFTEGVGESDQERNEEDADAEGISDSDIIGMRTVESGEAYENASQIGSSEFGSDEEGPSG